MPNPMVGAIIVHDDTNGHDAQTSPTRIGEGWHEKFGENHAEINAIENCIAGDHSPKGATMYVTLEPCCHTGKTPPCTDAIIKSGVKKVVIATLDPNEKVAGKGAAALRAAGIEIEIGLLEEEARKLNREFFTFHEKKRPFITLKVAMSLDGKIAKNRTEQTWLTGPRAQKQVHIMRSKHEAILVGAGTIIADNPHLGVRLVESQAGKDPLRVILQGKDPLPQDAAVFRDKNYLVLKEKSATEITAALHKKGITSLLVEGGQEVFNSFLASGLVDELKMLIAPVILGEDALPFTNINAALPVAIQSTQKLGQDVLITATPAHSQAQQHSQCHL